MKQRSVFVTGEIEIEDMPFLFPALELVSLNSHMEKAELCDCIQKEIDYLYREFYSAGDKVKENNLMDAIEYKININKVITENVEYEY